MDNLIAEVSGEDCQNLIRRMLILHEHAQLDPLIDEFAKLMAKKDLVCKIITPPRLHEVWPKENRSDEEIRWIANTYYERFGEYSGWRKVQ